MRSASAATVVVGRAGDAYGALREGAARLERVHPAAVLGPLAAAQVAIVLVLAHRIPHNGWLYYTGGDSTHYWTASWSLAHGWVPTAVASYGLPVLLWPLAFVSDSLTVILPYVVVVQVAIGGPLVVLALYGIGSRIAGRLFGYLAAAGWAVAPLVSLAYFYGHFRSELRTIVAPNVLGLTNLADFPSLVALCLAVWLLLRSLDTGSWTDIVLSGLLSGFALGIKPANAVFLPAPVLALAVARRWRHGAAFLVALVPAVATLTLWKWIGFGFVPGLSRVEVKTALGATPSLPLAASSTTLPFSWHTLTTNLAELREVAWSVLLLEWIVVAGSFALIRKAPAKGVLVSVWFLSYLLLKGSAEGRADVYQTTFFRLIEPAFPALVLLAAAVLLLVPTWGRRGPDPAPVERRPRVTRLSVAALVVLGLYPLVIVGVASATPPGKVVFQQTANQSIPVSAAFHLRVRHVDGHAVLSWQAPPTGATRVSYRIWRARRLFCAYHTKGGRDCLLRMPSVGVTWATTWTDPRPGAFAYRVSAMANENRNDEWGDFLLISPLVR